MSKRALDEEDVHTKKQVCNGVGTHLQNITIKKLFQAQEDLARQKKSGGNIPSTPAVQCEDCDRIIDDDFEDHQCVNCGRSVCKYCSIKSIHRNDVVECLNCI